MSERNPLPGWATRALAVLIVVQVALTCLFLGRRALPGRAEKLFDMDAEANVTTWWSAMLLAAVGVAAIIVAASHGRGSRQLWAWAIVGLGFLFLSMDEVAQIHEEVGQAFDSSNEGRYWPILYAQFLLAGAWAIWQALRPLERRMRALGWGSLLVLFAGVAAELASNSEDVRGRFEVVIEENTEYLGAGLLTIVFLVVASRRWRLSRGA